MNMINVRRLTVIAFLGAGMLPGISAQNSSLQVDTLNETKLPAQWDLQSCIDYALEQNITIRKNRVTAASTQIDVKTAKAALFPSLSFSTSQQVVNRPYQESSSRVSGSEIISTNSKTSYNGNYGLNASWTLYNGSKRLKTIPGETEQSGSRTGCSDFGEQYSGVYCTNIYSNTLCSRVCQSK